MNFRSAVPAECPRCAGTLTARGAALACPACGAVAEDFSPPRKMARAWRCLRWREAGGGWHVLFRDRVVATVRPEGGLYSWRILDGPVARALGMAGGEMEGCGYSTRGRAAAALKGELDDRRPPGPDEEG